MNIETILSIAVGGNGESQTLSGGDSVHDPYPNRSS